MQLFAKVPDFDFMSRRRIAVILSCVIIFFSLGSVGIRGLNFGVDFTGGVLLEVGYSDAANLTDVRNALADAGYDTALVQNFGSANDVLIRLPPSGDEEEGTVVRDRVLDTLREYDSSVLLRRIEFVGPQVGEELTEQGGLAMLFALILIFAYVMLRFNRKFAAGTITALVHDVIVVIGVFSFFELSFDLSVLAALLATIGYSLNDTIVVFDRIRENFRIIRRGTAERIINVSINQMLARTLITSFTTLLVLSALYIWGGQAVNGFAEALMVGVIVGTYSSIYVACTAALALKVSPADLLPPKRQEIDDMP
ncbi:MAG: protein translocase subunit SecF [Pseudomonadota bacterium]|nr:protein translocase subunit SecF [Pseudomonadota bacterium]